MGTTRSLSPEIHSEYKEAENCQRSCTKKFEPELHNILYILHELQDKNPQHYVVERGYRRRAPTTWGCPTATSTASRPSIPCSALRPADATSSGCAIRRPATSWVPRHVLDYLKQKLGVDVGQTTADGAFTLELASCLGVCGVAPAIMINDEMFGKLTPERVDTILEERRNGI